MRFATALARTLALPVLVALLLAACGGSDDQLGAKASARLVPLVHEVRARALAYDPAGTRQALVAVRDAVRVMRHDDVVGAVRMREILAAVSGVERRLSLVPTTTTTTTPPRTTRDPNEERRDNGNGNGKGKGKD